MMVVKERVRVKKHDVTKHLNSEAVELYLSLARSVWESAMMSSSPTAANAKKKEAVGWAVLAAKKVAEEEVDRGKTLEECLHIAAQVLIEKAKENL